MTKIDIERIWEALREQSDIAESDFPDDEYLFITKEDLEKAIAKVFQL